MMMKMPAAPKGGRRFEMLGSIRGRTGAVAGFAALVALTALVANGQPAAAADQGPTATPEQIQGMVHVCSSCHGFGGRSISPTFPRLAGQQEAYLEAQLKAFRDHKRADPHAQTYMWGMAAHLSDSMIHGLATYYSKQTPAPGKARDPALMAAGEKIFKNGIPSRGVLACAACHGSHGQGMAAFPRIAGLHRDYLAKQLQEFASNARANAIMHQNAKNLTADEISQVTAYLAAQ